jgi:hypothetical protein
VEGATHDLQVQLVRLVPPRRGSMAGRGMGHHSSDPQRTYQIFTKRPERIAAHLPIDWQGGYANVWLGVSIESARYDYRAALLCQFPAALGFISAEPLLGPLELTRVNPFDSSSDRRFACRDRDYIGINVLEWPKYPPLWHR